MTRFSTTNLPRPVVIQELDYEAARADRLGEYVDRLQAAGIDYEVGTDPYDPVPIAAEAAATGDTHFVAALNDNARVVLLESFAEDEDLDIHARKVGLQRFEGEEDEALRERIRLEKKSKSAAGPDDYYKAKARNFSVLVRDCEILRAETRNFSDRVLIMAVLTTDNGGLLSEELQAGLTDALNASGFRSRNVTVEVIPAVITTRNVVATLYLYPETPDSVVETARQNLITSAAADQKLGFDLTDSYLKSKLHLAGVQRVELTGWTDAFAGGGEAIRLGTVTVNPVRLSS
jgi:phage-related baseplate assembly protein